MTEYKRVFRDEVPAMRFIGKKYPDFGPFWGDWFANGWFDRIEEAMGGPDAILKIWENGGGYVGLERRAALPVLDRHVRTRGHPGSGGL